MRSTLFLFILAVLVAAVAQAAPLATTTEKLVSSSSSTSTSSSSSTPSALVLKTKKSLFRGEQASFQEFKAVKLAAVSPLTSFCNRFRSGCSSVCSSKGLAVAANTCSSAGTLSGGRSKFNFKCVCSRTDYTPAALVAAAQPATTSTVVKSVYSTSTATDTVLSTATSTSVVLSTSISIAESTSTQLIEVTTTQPDATVTVTSRVTPSAVVASVTSLVTPPVATSTRYSTTTLAPSTRTSVVTVTRPVPTTTLNTVSVATVTVTSTAVANAQNVKLALAASTTPILNNAAVIKTTVPATVAGFCGLYSTSCSTSCSTRYGVASQSCSAPSTNVYVLKCTCSDGAAPILHSLDAIQMPAATDTSTTTLVRRATKRVTSTTTVVVRATQVVKQAQQKLATVQSTSTVTVAGQTVTQSALLTLPASTVTRVTTSTLPVQTSYVTSLVTATPSAVTVTSTTSVGPSSTVTKYVTSTSTTTKTVLVTPTVSSSSSSTSSPTPTSSVVNVSPLAASVTLSVAPAAAAATSATRANPTGSIMVTDVSSSKTLGYVSTTQDESAYAYLLTADSDSAMQVSTLAGASLSGSLISLNIINGDLSAPFTNFGLEVQSMNDAGVQPVNYEFLLVTDTASSTTNPYPLTEHSDSAAFLANGVAWSLNSKSGALSAVWTNPKGSSPTTSGMSMFVICTDATVGSCFLTAAASNATWANFNTEGVTIKQVALTFVASS
ncbi:hypothetical protein BDZ90DRAFT_104770 [Jaminaea rosea]|uniref:Uncharacterized protein n=1 Tax=Jaminaea rosea TaxID=1569628 RepID=A0A316UVF8_9BASI|nr:hypothetical protein BDZ90DRAFT_104770 [Jaminaea rosea]PWN29290.1 hypothetical protein BDZ90DRAFT_104770 [Jaminaea rosea]